MGVADDGMRNRENRGRRVVSFIFGEFLSGSRACNEFSRFVSGGYGMRWNGMREKKGG